jgi:hypothetical protein
MERGGGRREKGMAWCWERDKKKRRRKGNASSSSSLLEYRETWGCVLIAREKLFHVPVPISGTLVGENERERSSLVVVRRMIAFSCQRNPKVPLPPHPQPHSTAFNHRSKSNSRAEQPIPGQNGTAIFSSSSLPPFFP